MTGQTWMNKVAETILTQSGSQQAAAKPEDEVAKIKKQQERVQAQYDLANTVDALSNPPSLQQIREQRQAEIEGAARQAQEEARRLHDENMARIQAERDQAIQHAQEEEERRRQSEMAFQQQQTQMLLDKLSELQAQRKPFDQQIEESLGYAERVAERMGFKRGDVAVPGADNPQLQLEITKMQLDAAQKQREWEWKMEQEKREWEIKLMQMKQEREFKQVDMERQAKRDEMFMAAPSQIGAAFARGIRDRGDAHGPTEQRVAQQPPRSQAYEVTLAPGQELTVPCPNCQTVVGLGPKTDLAKCVGCDTQFLVKRRGDMAAQPPVDNFSTEEEE